MVVVVVVVVVAVAVADLRFKAWRELILLLSML